MKKLLALFLLFFATPAFAQAWNDPNWTDGTVPAPDWQTWDRLMAEGQVLGDGSINGGTPPALAYAPASIGASALGYTASNFLTSATGYTIVPATNDHEAKVRFGCDVVLSTDADPILFFGQTHAGHKHTVFGPSSFSGSSTYQTNRSSPGISSCIGGPLNMTAYWEPSMLVNITTGYQATIRPWQTIFYYATGAGDGKKLTSLLNGFAFIGGVNPSDPTDTARRAEYSAAGLIYPGNGWIGYECFTIGADGLPETGDDTRVFPDDNAPGALDNGANQGYSKALKKSDGTDPWSGRCTDGYFVASVAAPECWDGHNLTSPDGRGHVRYLTRTGDSAFTKVCPKTWYRVPHFAAKIYFRHGGWTDYQNWYLSSDRYGLTQANWRLNGSTMHFDWKNGWQRDILDSWQKNCLGMTINGVAGTTADCAFGLIGPGQGLNYGVPGQSGFSNNPILNGNADLYLPNDLRRYMVINPGESGPFQIHGH